MTVPENSNERKHREMSVASGHRLDATLDGHQVMSASSGIRPEQRNIKVAALNGLLTNQLLAALPGEDFARLLPHLEPVTLSADRDLYLFAEGIHAYFPETAIITHLHVLTDGRTAETAMIGREGMVGLSIVFSARQPVSWTRVLSAGTALRIRREIFREEFRRGLALQRLVLACAGARMAHVSQRAVCNGLHRVKERLCSWLLMLQDRTGENRLQLTHERISSQLGMRRAGVTVIAGELQDSGLIAYNRGQIHILDRPRLEAAACECYRTLKQPAAQVV